MYYVILAEGFEEIEALAQIDVLRRAGIDVMSASVAGEYVTGAHGITVKSDITVDEALSLGDAQGVILPGGMPGTTNIAKSEKAVELIKKVNSQGGLVAAICAAPSCLGALGILKGKKATCYPGFENALDGAEILYDDVVADGNVITSRGPGTAIKFGLCLAERITGKSQKALAEAMIYEKSL